MLFNCSSSKKVWTCLAVSLKPSESLIKIFLNSSQVTGVWHEVSSQTLSILSRRALFDRRVSVRNSSLSFKETLNARPMSSHLEDFSCRREKASFRRGFF